MVATTESSTVAVVLLRARSPWDPDPDRTAAELSDMDTAVREEVARFNGLVAARVGTLWQAVFGARPGSADQDERAVLAALNIRRRLTDGDARTVRAAVVSSEVEALDDCHTWLPRVPSMEVWVSDQTHRRTETKIDYRPATAGMWAAAGVA